MSELTQVDRKIYRNIHISQIRSYRLPLAGWLSILHRVSGAGLFLFLPFFLWMFRKSLTSEISFGIFRSVTGHWYVKVLLLGLIWAFLHHFAAGLRYLVMDLHYGLDKDVARKSSLAVFAVSLPLLILVGLKLFGVF